MELELHLPGLCMTTVGAIRADPNDPEWHARTVWRLFTGAEEWRLYTGAEEWPRRQAERKRVVKTVGAIAGAE